MTRPAVRPGIWTPWAAVLCAPCHGPTYRRLGQTTPIPGFDTLHLAQDLDDGDVVCACTKCGKPVAVASDVGFPKLVVDLVGSGVMEQTGGMCCAASWTTEGSIIVVTAMDEEIDVGVYECHEAWMEGEYRTLFYFSGTTAGAREAADHVRGILASALGGAA